MTLGRPTPVLRMFDEAATRDFWVGFLGFHVVFEHRFAADMPLYMGVRRDTCELHLSQHHGDASPGAAVRIPCAQLETFVGTLPADYRFARPGAPDVMPWGLREVTITDPSANRLTFFEPT